MATGETRLHRRIRRDFPEPGSAEEIMRLLAEVPRRTGSETPRSETLRSERVQAAIILLAQGNVHRFRHAATSATEDWRDVLVAAGLAHDDWPAVLDRELGPVTPGERST